jgi:hypothetical protein
LAQLGDVLALASSHNIPRCYETAVAGGLWGALFGRLMSRGKPFPAA